MRTLNFPQSNNLFYSQPELNLSALASMLNQQSFQQPTLLTKRPNPAYENMLFQDTIQKKLKTNYMQGLPQPQPQSFIPNLSNLIFQEQNYQEQMNLMNLQRVQQAPLTLIKPVPTYQPQGGFNLLPKKLEIETVKPVLNKNIIKEEFIADQDNTTTHGSPLSTSAKSSKSSKSATPSNRAVAKEAKKTIPVISQPSLVDGPVLGEFTDAFPEWDLATIFNFLNGEKSIEVFEAERQKKLARKMARKPVQRKSKKQNLKKYE